MQTARRAAASVAQAGDGQIPIPRLIDDLIFSRGAVVRLGAQDYLCHLIALAKQPVHMGKESCCSFLAVGDKPDGLAFKTLSSEALAAGNYC